MKMNISRAAASFRAENRAEKARLLEEYAERPMDAPLRWESLMRLLRLHGWVESPSLLESYAS